MGQPYVDYPGSAGRYASCASVNQLTSDDAHIQQSKGTWQSGGNAINVAKVASTDSLFGDYTLEYEAAATTNTVIRHALYPVTAGETYAVSIAVKNSHGRPMDVVVNFQSAGFGNTGYPEVDYAVAGDGSWNIAAGTVLAPATSVWMTIRIDIPTAEAGEKFYLKQAHFSHDSDATFVPSLRIVGDLDLRARLAADDWTPASRQTFLCNDDVSTEGYRFRLEVDGDISIFHGDGGSLRTIRSTAGVGATDGDAVEIRAAIDVTSANLVTFYKDEVVLGDTVAIAAGAGVPSGDTLIVGADSGLGSRLAGDVYWVEVRDGIDGPVVARMDARDVLAAVS